jgi:hypothetical protein
MLNLIREKKLTGVSRFFLLSSKSLGNTGIFQYAMMWKLSEPLVLGKF